MLYYKNEKNVILDGIETGQTILVNCSNFEIRNINISDNTDIAVEIAFSNKIKIYDCYIGNSCYGIYNFYSYNNLIYNCSIANNDCDGIVLYCSYNSSIYNCEIGNNYYGIGVSYSYNNSIYNCNITSNNWDGIGVFSSYNNSIYDCNINSNNWGGIRVYYSCNNISIKNSKIYNNNFAGLCVSKCYNITMQNCKIFNNYWGIYLYYSSNNTIFNNYFQNAINAYDNGNNTWNVSKKYGRNIVGGNYIAGNYWHDYMGNDTDGDAIGDEALPYNCNGNIKYGGDFMPLVTPWDVNKDGIVNLLDMIIIGQHFGFSKGEENYIPNGDINKDNIINILDLIIVGQHFGENW